MAKRFEFLGTGGKVGAIALLIGFGWFSSQLAELIHDHAADGWTYFRNPLGVADVLSLIGSTVTMVAGALGVPFGRVVDAMRGKDVDTTNQEKP